MRRGLWGEGGVKLAASSPAQASMQRGEVGEGGGSGEGHNSIQDDSLHAASSNSDLCFHMQSLWPLTPFWLPHSGPVPRRAAPRPFAPMHSRHHTSRTHCSCYESEAPVSRLESPAPFSHRWTCGEGTGSRVVKGRSGGRDESRGGSRRDGSPAQTGSTSTSRVSESTGATAFGRVGVGGAVVPAMAVGPYLRQDRR